MYEARISITNIVKVDDEPHVHLRGRSLEYYDIVYRRIVRDLLRNGIELSNEPGREVLLKVDGKVEEGSLLYIGVILFASDLFTAYTTASSLLREEGYLYTVQYEAALELHPQNYGIRPLSFFPRVNFDTAPQTKGIPKAPQSTPPLGAVARNLRPLLLPFIVVLLMVATYLERQEAQRLHREILSEFDALEASRSTNVPPTIVIQSGDQSNVQQVPGKQTDSSPVSPKSRFETDTSGGAKVLRFPDSDDE